MNKLVKDAVVVLFGLAILSVDAATETADLIDRAKGGPSLLFTPAMLPGIRERVASDPDATAWWNSFRAKLDQTINDEIKIPDRGYQWFHWYTCKKCGVRLKTEGAKRHVCSKCGAVYSGSPYDEVVLATVHEGLAKAVRDNGIAYGITGDRKYAGRAREILLGYSAKYCEYPLHNKLGFIGPENPNAEKGGRVAEQVLGECVWLIPIVQGFDAIADSLAEEDRRMIESRLLRPAIEVVRSHPMKIHNHECWHLSAWGLAALALGEAELLDEAVNGRYGLTAQMREGVLEDGLWFEGSLGYQFYTLDAVVCFETALANLGRPPDEGFRRMLYSPFGLLSPGWMLPALNDSKRIAFEPGSKSAVYEPAFSWWGDAAFNAWVSAVPRRTMEYALYGRPAGALEKMPADSQYVSQCFDASGIAVLRSRSRICSPEARMPDNYIAIDYGPHGGWHGHFDKLNLILWGRGTLLAEDPGCIEYGNPRQFGWYKTTLAHNTLVVDGRSQQAAKGRRSAFSDRPNGAAVSLAAGEIAPGVQVSRKTILSGDVVLDLISAKSDDEHDYEWAFHSRGAFSTPLGEGDPFVVPNPNPKFSNGRPVDTDGSDAWGWVENARTRRHDGAWRASWTKDGVRLDVFQKAFSVGGGAPLSGDLRTGVGSAQPASESCGLAVNRVRGRNVIFPTVMLISGKDDSIPEVEIFEGYALVDGRRYAFELNDEWSPSCAEGLLKRWCDALISYQIPENSDPRVKGAIICPACASAHGRVCDLVYPLTFQWVKTHDCKYLDAAKLAVDWTEATLVREDGGTYNDYRSSWSGTTTFAQIALGKTLLSYGMQLPQDVRDRWMRIFCRETQFLKAKFSDQQFVGRVNVNYPAAYCEAMAIAGKLLGAPEYIVLAKQMASRLYRQFLPSGLLMGEGHPMDASSPRGRRYVDLGYNLEETLPALLGYAEIADDRRMEALVVTSACAHLEFLLPDGALDNSFGSRSAKWTYYGSRTTDGFCALLGKLARRGVPWAIRALDRHLRLLEHCTLGNGLLAGGLNYADADEPACVHHSFTHAKSLVDLLQCDIPVTSVETALPRETAQGVRDYPELGVQLVSVGPWRATFSTSDAFMGPSQLTVGGGSPTLLWRADTGPLILGSMSEYFFVEEHNMQDLRHERKVLTTTPHFEANGCFSCADLAAEVTTRLENGVFILESRGRLCNAKRTSGPTYETKWSLSEKDFTMKGKCAENSSFVLPLVVTARDDVRIKNTKVTISNPTKLIVVESSHRPKLMQTDRGERAFTPVAGALTAQIYFDIPKEEFAEIRIRVLAK